MGKIKMEGERNRYTVMAHDERYAIMTKPFNAQKTYLYCISDLERGIRGPCNMIFGLPIDGDLQTKEGAEEALAWLHSGAMEVSWRNRKELAQSEIDQLKALPARDAADFVSCKDCRYVSRRNSENLGSYFQCELLDFVSFDSAVDAFPFERIACPEHQPREVKQ